MAANLRFPAEILKVAFVAAVDVTVKANVQKIGETRPPARMMPFGRIP